MTSKSALCIGINYLGSPWQLRGCINDAYRLAQTLKTGYGYTRVRTITDDSFFAPTKQNILRAIRELIDDESQVKTLTFSGHGSYQRDTNGDERDGYDELWLSSDFLPITDDELYVELARLRSDKKLYILSDSCHSGTVMDLPFTLSTNKRFQRNHLKNLTCPNIFMISGCLDSEFSYDVVVKSLPCGAATWTLLYVLQNQKEQTPWTLVEQMRTLMKRMRWNQNPQWSSSSTFHQKLIFFH